MTQEQQINSAMKSLAAISEAIRELKRVPSGHLYAMICGKMSLESYNSIIGILKRAGLVSESANELIWIGPAV